MPMGRMSAALPRSVRRWLAGAAMAATGGAAVAAAFWLVADLAVQQNINHWRGKVFQQKILILAPNASGWFDGFPQGVRRRFAGPAVMAPGWRLTAAAGEALFDLRRHDEAQLRLTDATLHIDDAGGGAPAVFTAAAATLTVSLENQPLQGGGALPRRAWLTLENAAASLPGQPSWRAAQAAATLSAPDSPPADHQQPGLTLTLSAAGVVSPVLAQWLGDGTGDGAATLTVLGAPPALNQMALETWRVDGGVVELTGLSAGLAPLQVQGDATFALDRDLQPIGAGTLRIAGADAVLSRLAQQGGGPFKPKEIKQARQMAALLTQPDPNGGPPRLTLPLTAQDRRLFVGPFAVARLPDAGWR